METPNFPAEEGGIVVSMDLEGNGTVSYKQEVHNPCPECEEELYVTGRCSFCPYCGWESCSL